MPANARVAIYYRAPVLGELSRRLRYETRPRYVQLDHSFCNVSIVASSPVTTST